MDGLDLTILILMVVGSAIVGAFVMLPAMGVGALGRLGGAKTRRLQLWLGLLAAALAIGILLLGTIDPIIAGKLRYGIPVFAALAAVLILPRLWMGLILALFLIVPAGYAVITMGVAGNNTAYRAQFAPPGRAWTKRSVTVELGELQFRYPLLSTKISPRIVGGLGANRTIRKPSSLELAQELWVQSDEGRRVVTIDSLELSGHYRLCSTERQEHIDLCERSLDNQSLWCRQCRPADAAYNRDADANKFFVHAEWPDYIVSEYSIDDAEAPQPAPADRPVYDLPDGAKSQAESRHTGRKKYLRLPSRLGDIHASCAVQRGDDLSCLRAAIILDNGLVLETAERVELTPESGFAPLVERLAIGLDRLNALEESGR